MVRESCGSVGGSVVVAISVRKPQEDLQSTNLQSTNQEDLQSTNLGPWGSQRMNHQPKTYRNGLRLPSTYVAHVQLGLHMES